MKSRIKAVFHTSGVLLFIVLILAIANLKADNADSVEANDYLQKLSTQSERSMSDALEHQKGALRDIMDGVRFSSYEIIYFKKLNDENYEFELQGIVDYGTAVVYDERYKFNINTSKLKDSGSNANVKDILNMIKGPLAGLLVKEKNHLDGLGDFNVVYYKDSRSSEYEFGIEANGVQYYFLLENYGQPTQVGRWVVLGWAEGSVPDDWNDVLAVQQYASIKDNKLSEQEYERFFEAYADNIYKLMDESSKLASDIEKQHARKYDSKSYELVAESEVLLYQEAEKAMKIVAPDKYKLTHDFLVKAMYRVSRLASVYVKGSEGYMDENEYNNWKYGLVMSDPREIINKAYACFEVEERNEAFDENKHNAAERENAVEITRLIDKEIYHYTNFEISYARIGVKRVNRTQYKYLTDEGSWSGQKSYCYTFEKDKDGKWIIVDKTEL